MTQHKTIIRFELIACLLKSINVFNLLVATKNLRKNYPFFGKPVCVLLIGETRTQ